MPGDPSSATAESLAAFFDFEPHHVIVNEQMYAGRKRRETLVG